MNNYAHILEAKIVEVKKKIKEKTRERGEAAGVDTNSWHDNSAFDLANEELMVLYARLHNLEEELLRA